ncbi:MAG: hypothetical protein OEV64_11010 [Desulfobulbaceae bacterium]|nr:hypothetical protein [Desulfobulbaceae bacterium]
MNDRFKQIDLKIAAWMNRYSFFLLRISIGLIFVWFGLLKPLGLSPEEELIKNTVYWISPDIFIPILGWWEVIIGLCLLYRPLIRLALLLLFIQLPGTLLPLFLLPDVCFQIFPYGLTLEGQYIIKNLFLVSAAFVVGSTVRNRGDDDSRIL